MRELIERQTAIDALERKKDKNAKGDIAGFYNQIIQNDIGTLMQLPPAQPEPLTDKEQRIFLEAMWREKDVCRAVDKEFPDAKVNLTDVCREIVRKVIGALWE